MKLRVGIDIDGFLTDIATFQLKNGKKYFKEVKNDKGYSIQEIFGCSSLEETKFWCKNAKYYLEKPRENADLFSQFLHSIGAEVYIITSRAHTSKSNPLGAVMRHGVRTWLKNNHIYYDKIVYCARDKVATIKKYNIDYMGEDSPVNAKEIGEHIPVLLMKAPYNEDIKGDNIYLIEDFIDAIDVIRDLEDNKTKKRSK